MDHLSYYLVGCGQESNSHRNEPTTWSDTILHFEHGKDGKNAGTVSGEGTSLWKNLQIEFKIEGTYDWDTKETSLRKQHLEGTRTPSSTSALFCPTAASLRKL